MLKTIPKNRFYLSTLIVSYIIWLTHLSRVKVEIKDGSGNLLSRAYFRMPLKHFLWEIKQYYVKKKEGEQVFLHMTIEEILKYRV